MKATQDKMGTMHNQVHLNLQKKLPKIATVNSKLLSTTV